jgi:hypothetical protein
MDPDATLDELRLTTPGHWNDRRVELLEALATWLAGKGYIPAGRAAEVIERMTEYGRWLDMRAMVLA